MKLKFLALFMALLLACACFVACNNDTTENESETGTETGTETETETDTNAETPGDQTPGDQTPGDKTPEDDENLPDNRPPEEKYADLYADGYTYYTIGLVPAGSTDKFILDQGNFEQWYKFQLLAGESMFGGTYVLATDVKLNEGNAADWKTTKPKKVSKTEHSLWGFEGVFDGNGKTISGFCMVAGREAGDNGNLGFFGRLIGAAEVKNLRIVNSYIESKGDSPYCSVGVFASRLSGPAVKVTNCYTDAIISGNQGLLGGIVGMVTGAETPQINNCVFAGKIEANGYIGGILGFADANAKVAITNCMNLGELVASENQVIVGGIVGASAFAGNVIGMTNCVNLSSKVPNALIGYPGRSMSAMPIIDFVMITDIGVSNIAPADAEIKTSNIIEMTFAEFIDSNDKVFDDWTYEAGYIPNPTTHTKIPTSAVTTVSAN